MKIFLLLFACLGLLIALTQFSTLRKEKDFTSPDYESDSPLVNPLGTTYKAKLTVRVGAPLLAFVVGVFIFLFAE